MLNTFSPLLKSSLLVSLPYHSDTRGTLWVCENTVANMLWKRAFWIKDIPAGEERGNHAHRSCHELLCAVSGSFDVELSNGRDTLQVHLDNPNEGLLIPAMVWCRLYNFSPDAIVLCFASQEYIPEGYINDYEEFKTKVL